MRNIQREDLETTSSSFVYVRLLKLHREDVGDINCGYCRYHRNENATRRPAHRCWKIERKTQHR